MIAVAEHLGSAVEITAPHEAESCNVTLESAGGGQSVRSAPGAWTGTCSHLSYCCASLRVSAYTLWTHDTSGSF